MDPEEELVARLLDRLPEDFCGVGEVFRRSGKFCTLAEALAAASDALGPLDVVLSISDDETSPLGWSPALAGVDGASSGTGMPGAVFRASRRRW
jgi:hypothetical protein